MVRTTVAGNSVSPKGLSLSVQLENWPVLLLLPLFVAFAVRLSRRSLSDMSRSRAHLALLLRCLLLTLLVLALAGVRLVRRGSTLAVVFLVDQSRSIRPDQRERAQSYVRDALGGRRQGDRAGLVTFAADPQTQFSLGQPIDTAHLRDTGVRTSTDISQALRQARNELDTAGRDSGKRIVLLSDGNENAGRALAELADLAADHIQLDTVSLPSSLTREALIERVVIPSHVKIGEPFAVRLVVSSLTAQQATLRLARDGRPAGPSKRVALHPGKNVIVFEQMVDKAGFYRYSADLDAPDDTIPENNHGEGFVWVRGRPTVLYVADNPALTEFLRKSARGENIDVVWAPADGMPTSAATLQPYDAVFLSNVRADSLSFAQMTALQVACRDFGIGFGMVGGPDSFGAGGYRGTPIEDMLPVSMDVKKQRRIPSVAVALVIEDLEIQSSVNMSIEAAKATMDLLEPIDQVGVLDCNGPGSWSSTGSVQSPGGNWRIPMQHVTDREALKAKMQSLTGMGDPPSYGPYLLEAARVLNQTDAKVKHIIFLGDGDAIWEGEKKDQSETLGRLRSMGITLSTIATGADTGGERFMAAMAYIGGGQAYVADRPSDLPRLLLKDEQTFSQPPIIEETFQAAPAEDEELFKGIDWSGAPPLRGYNVTNLKDTADLALRTHRNDPLFASWRYGLGRTAAFMSDDRAAWAAYWLGWPGYSKFWAQTLRWTLRPFGPGEYSTQAELDGERGRVTVDAIDRNGGFVNELKLLAHIAPPRAGGGQHTPPFETPLLQTGPGHYEASFDVPAIGTYLINVLNAGARGRTDSTVVGLSNAYSPEYRTIGANTTLLAELAHTAGGRADPPASAAFGGDRPTVAAAQDETRLLLLLAMALLPLDIAVRRIAIGLSDLKRALAWLAGKRVAAAPPRISPEIERLLGRKEAAAGRLRPAMPEREPAVIGAARAATAKDDYPDPVPQPEPAPAPATGSAGAGEAAGAEAPPQDNLARLRAAKLRARREIEKPGSSEPPQESGELPQEHGEQS
jgi:uncharacterized membrane protein/Mg-chelatase subunit ChlD